MCDVWVCTSKHTTPNWSIERKRTKFKFRSTTIGVRPFSLLMGLIVKLETGGRERERESGARLLYWSSCTDWTAIGLLDCIVVAPIILIITSTIHYTICLICERRITGLDWFDQLTPIVTSTNRLILNNLNEIWNHWQHSGIWFVYKQFWTQSWLLSRNHSLLHLFASIYSWFSSMLDAYIKSRNT